MPKSTQENKFEQKYYKEKNHKIYPITKKGEKNKIDAYMKTHRNMTPGSTSRESGYSQYIVLGEDVEINNSMLNKKRVTGSTNSFFISRLKKAPALPVSCLSSTEHVIAMKNKVKDFVSDDLPKAKKQVMYELLLLRIRKGINSKTAIKNIFKLLIKHDNNLNENNVSISYDNSKKIFVIQSSTQVADIQLLIKALTSTKSYKIINCQFSDIGLNQGVCLVKRDLSNPIHALANIVNGSSQKGFLERDAGTTSGEHTSVYQDKNWTFNFFTSLGDMCKKTDYPDDCYAIKIFNSR